MRKRRFRNRPSLIRFYKKYSAHTTVARLTNIRGFDLNLDLVLLDVLSGESHVYMLDYIYEIAGVEHKATLKCLFPLDKKEMEIIYNPRKPYKYCFDWEVFNTPQTELEAVRKRQIPNKEE